ncbi:hypothetical protein [Aminipila sp.]|uniref:hypothetical protein n=1 Tax=Aminipila sp. TaxID=2060095 RepID=UPI00289665D8|nr:hypothetical protein [Aminipila sp.]
MKKRRMETVVVIVLISILCMGCIQRIENNYSGNLTGFVKGNNKIDFVVYNTETDNFRKIASFPNDTFVEGATMTANGQKYAYTIWNEQGTHEYLVVKDIENHTEKEFFRDEKLPSELKGVMFIDPKNILLRKVEIPNGYPMEKILILDTETGKTVNIQEGYNALITGENNYNDKSKNTFELLTEKEDVNNILQQYGSSKSSNDIEDDTVIFSKLSNPTIVESKSKIYYTKTLFRNIAVQGEGVILGSSIWCYDLNSNKSELLYTAEDDNIIGYITVSLNGDTLVISKFRKTTGEDGQLFKINLSSPKEAKVIEKTKKNGYVFIDPMYLDDDTITFLSVENGMPLEDAKRYILNIDTGDIKELEANYIDKKQLFRNFSRIL